MKKLEPKSEFKPYVRLSVGGRRWICDLYFNNGGDRYSGNFKETINLYVDTKEGLVTKVTMTWEYSEEYAYRGYTLEEIRCGVARADGMFETKSIIVEAQYITNLVSALNDAYNSGRSLSEAKAFTESIGKHFNGASALTDFENFLSEHNIIYIKQQRKI